MDQYHFSGALLRLLRIQRNWSQETLCSGICAVSYLSKIEQGRVVPNEALLNDLFARLGVAWNSDSGEDGTGICEKLYDLIFADDHRQIEKCRAKGLLNRDEFTLGPRYLDYLVIRAYCDDGRIQIPSAMEPLLDGRQKCLLDLLEGKGTAVNFTPYVGSGPEEDHRNGESASVKGSGAIQPK